MVVGSFREDVGGVGILASGVHDNLQFTSKSIVQWDQSCSVLASLSLSKCECMARFEVFGSLPTEAIKLEHRDGQGDFVLFEIGEGGVVKQHARVEHKNFGLHHLF